MIISELKDVVDIVIIAVREDDELLQLRRRFPQSDSASGRQHYSISRIIRDDGQEVVVALVKSLEGPQKSQQVMTDVVFELEPRLTLKVGIAGGVPSDDYTLGDVVLSSGGLDVTRGEVGPQEIRSRPLAFALHPRARRLIDNLEVSSSWSNEDQIEVPQPPLTWPARPVKNCPDAWARRVLDKLKVRFGPQAPPRQPVFVKGTIASGSLFYASPALADAWEKHVKNKSTQEPLAAIEMEVIGIYQASYEDDRHHDWLAICGISDIIGLERDRAWKNYASAAAAAFALAFVKSLRSKPRSVGRVGVERSHLNVERLRQLALDVSIATSDVIDWPATLPSGASIPRPERKNIEQHLSDPKVAVIVVLGEAGSGKSALLATIAKELKDAGKHVLGVRLDRLAKDAITDEQLRRYLNLSEPLVDTANALALQGPVTVIIDQLDALCDLMTERAGRLALVLDTIERLANIKSVHIILGCRPFEYKHDVRLRRVRSAVVTLALPSWIEVKPHLEAAQVDTELLSTDLREELRRPQALATFLDLIRQGHDWRRLTTYHSMCEFLWEAHVEGGHGRRRQVLFELAQWMAREEVLTRPLAQVDDWRLEIGRLESAGWLQRVGLASNAGVTFRHQSLFDFAYARAVVASGGSLLEQVLKRQGFFVRRRVWAVLSYLREAGPGGPYLHEFERLWNAPTLRRHLKRLLIDFLGQLPIPWTQEVHLLLGAMNNSTWRSCALVAVGRGPGWYEHLRARELPRAMSDPAVAGSCLPILMRASSDQIDQVLTLLKQHWMADLAGYVRSAAVLSRFPAWSTRAFDFAQRLAEQIPIARKEEIEELIFAVLPASPDRAAVLLERALTAELSRVMQDLRATPEPIKPADNADWKACFDWQSAMDARQERIRHLFEGPVSWTRLSSLVEVAPRAILDAVWPVMRRALEAIARPLGVIPSFRIELRWVDDSIHHGNSIVNHLHNALIALAQKDTNGFVEFLHREGESDLMTVHMLLLEGLSEIVTSRPEIVLEYFRKDLRRLFVGPVVRQGSTTLQFLTGASSRLESSVQQELAAIFMGWLPIDKVSAELPAEQRLHHLKFARAHRLLPIRLIDSDGRLLDDEHQTDGSQRHHRLMDIRKRDRWVAECGWASSRRKPEIGGR